MGRPHVLRAVLRPGGRRAKPGPGDVVLLHGRALRANRRESPLE